ncbi:MAG TPA: folylpolyglutamate synthase/dihydrofolate synthase family protein, partial [Ktedonobacterales bacterium]|nr:folylpolyglutamate synthase/dihydrofolate synthase family protein [Ktedonobacterales bacterium]
LSYTDALAWIYGFSDTERTGNFVHDREDNLARERTLLEQLGNPQRTYGVTHIAGTKGKGSTSAMLAAIVQAAGIRTGLYTQPDLHTFRERMRVDGHEMPENALPALVPQLQEALARIGSELGSYITYEVATALAFLYFHEAGVQHAVIEVGLGGRLDATNVVEPLATAITSISYDHMQVLGNTLAEIAGEKAGIIKPGVPVVCSARAPEALETIARIAASRGAPLIRVGPDGTDNAYRYRAGNWDSERQYLDIITPTTIYRDIALALLGEHQLENAIATVALAELLRERGLPIDEAAIRTGLRQVRWPARLQVVGRKPWVVVDGAHNADSFSRMFAALRRHFPFQRLILVLGLMADKDLPGIAATVRDARVDSVIATAVAHPRAAAPAAIATVLHDISPTMHVDTVLPVSAALEAALKSGEASDLVCVAGSLYLAGEALRCFAQRPETAHNIEIAGVDINH